MIEFPRGRHHHRHPHKIIFLRRFLHMNPITSLSLVDGATAHITAVVLDQYGNPMTSAMAQITDPGPSTTFAPDAGTTAAGTLTGAALGTDSIVATYLGLTATLPVTVTPAPSVATSIVFTMP
jgi:hypothetical protein